MDVMETRERRSIDDLLHDDHYTPQELADLLGIPVEVVCEAAFAHQLPARIAGHDILRITRADALAWLRDRA